MTAPAAMLSMVFAQMGDVPRENRQEDRRADRGGRGRSIRSFNDKRGSQRPSRAPLLLHQTTERLLVPIALAVVLLSCNMA